MGFSNTFTPTPSIPTLSELIISQLPLITQTVGFHFTILFVLVSFFLSRKKCPLETWKQFKMNFQCGIYAIKC